VAACVKWLSRITILDQSLDDSLMIDTEFDKEDHDLLMSRNCNQTEVGIS
jgi:hypothetical protein